MTTKILMAAESSIACDGFVELLQREPGIEIVGRIEESSRVLKNLTLKPDIVILASSLCHEEELRKTIYGFKKNSSHTRILLFLDEDTPDVSLMQYLTIGVDGYIRRLSTIANVIDAIRSVRAGNIWAERKLLNKFVVCHPLPVADIKSNVENEHMSLTKREKEIISLLLLGLPNKALSDRLHISEKTVKTHLNNIFKKQKVNNRTQLAISFLHSH